MPYNLANSAASARFQVRWSSHSTAFALVGTMPAWSKRATVVLEAISLGSPEASITAYTLYPAPFASNGEHETSWGPSADEPPAFAQQQPRAACPSWIRVRQFLENIRFSPTKDPQ